MKNNVLKRILVFFATASLLFVGIVAFENCLIDNKSLMAHADEVYVAEVIDASGNSSYVSVFDDALTNENVTIKLLIDITLSKYTEFKKNTTIIFNGYKISRNGYYIGSDGLTMEVNTYTELKFANALSNHNYPKEGSTTTIKLLNDIAIEENFAVNTSMSLILDLNNHVFDGNQKSLINAGTLEIIDSSSNDCIHYWIPSTEGLWKIQDSEPTGQEYYTTVGSCITNLVSEDRNNAWDPKYGALCNQGTLTINNVDLIGNIGGMGGALYNYGNKVASVINCNILGNVANIAGGVANKGILTIENSKINYNVANNEVGGIYNDHILTIKDSEIKNNISYGADSFSSIINEYPSNKYPSAGIYSFFSDEEEEEIIINNEYVRTSVTLKGKVVVTDNISLVEQGKFISANFIVACNIDVDVKELTSESNIGVTKLTATEPDVVGGDIPILGTVVTSCDESDLSYFYADDDNKIVYYNNGTIELTNAANVEFVSNGGNEIDSKKVRLNTSVEAPLAPTKDGYTFGGWYKDEALNNAWNFNEDVVTSSTTLYAKWNINSYTVSYNSNGGSSITAATINYNNNLNTPTAPTKEGYTFSGWYKDEALNNAWNFSEDVVTKDTTLYAKWNINSYTVTFNSNGGSNITTATIDYNNNLTNPTTPTKDGHTFGGWYKDEALNNAWNFSEDVVTSSTTLYAKWNINSYTVSFNSNGGSSVASVTINYNNNLTSPTAPTKDGYTFSGWYKDESLTYAWNFNEDVVTKDTTLYAKWTENKIDNPVIEDDKEEDEGLSIGLIILIIVSIIFGLLLIYLVIYLFVYKKKELNNKFFKAIYSWLDKVLESKKELK